MTRAAARAAARLLAAYAAGGLLGSDPELLFAVHDLRAYLGADEMTTDELRAKATELAAAGDAMSAAVLRVLSRLDQTERRSRLLLDANRKLREQVRGHCTRIAEQAELLARRAERKDAA